MKSLALPSLTIILTFISAHVLAEPFTAGLTALSREHATTAYRAWLKVAETGSAEGQNNVGFLYERGLGVSQDYKQAEAWYMMASDQGLPSAKHNLAMLTYKGLINNKDWRKSVEWLKEADQMAHSNSLRRQPNWARREVSIWSAISISLACCIQMKSQITSAVIFGQR